MRCQGRIKDWKDDRGFGFVAPNGGGTDVFLHISAFVYRPRTPVLGDLVTYELSTDNKGRARAVDVQFVRDSRDPRRDQANPAVAILLGTLLLSAIGYVAYVRLSHPNSTISASVYKIFSARDALRSNSEFQCSPAKSFCSQMSSCAEAFFHQERCNVGVMDGDDDGIPCEQQWCN